MDGGTRIKCIKVFFFIKVIKPIVLIYRTDNGVLLLSNCIWILIKISAFNNLLGIREQSTSQLKNRKVLFCAVELQILVFTIFVQNVSKYELFILT